MVNTEDIYSENQVWTRWKFVDLCFTSLTNVWSFWKKFFNLFIWVYNLRCEVLAKNLPLRVFHQINLLSFKKITNLLVINLDNWDTNLIAIGPRSFSYPFKNFLKGSSGDTSIMACSFHCVSFTRTCLTICNYANIIPVQSRYNHWTNFIVNIFLVWIFAKNSCKFILAFS